MTEFAAAGRSGLSAYVGLALRARKPLSHIVELAAENRLGELFDSRGFVGKPLTGAEALGRMARLRYGPGEKPRSPAALIGELRARRFIWGLEAEEIQPERDPAWRLAQIYARRIPPWSEQ